MIKTIGYATQAPNQSLKRLIFERSNPGPHDLLIEILYCGICHSDIHEARNEWLESNYPMVPGHEIVGHVIAVGNRVTRFNVGDRVGVGSMIDSCRQCDMCSIGSEQYCRNGCTMTYNSFDKNSQSFTFGGFSTHIVVPEHFVLAIPAAFSDKDLPGVAPLMCAGITTYSPLRSWKINKDKNVGIVGIGGLGHLAIKIAHALQANVTAFTSSPNKLTDMKRLGASNAILSTDVQALQTVGHKFDFILDTRTVAHDLTPYLNLLEIHGTLCLVGLPPQNNPGFHASTLILNGSNLAGSLTGGIAQTQEMLNFCAQHHITADVELIKPADINEAFNHVVQKQARYRYVIDIQKM